MTIDLRSDTLTKPTKAMREAMLSAPVGDDVYGEDPTVNELEEHVANLLGKDAALYLSSGTQSNLCAILAHCQRGDEYLVGQGAHTYRYEAGGAAVLGGIQPQPIEMGADGAMALSDIERYIKPKPNMYHFANSKLLCLENTKDGMILPADYVRDAQELARSHGLSTHLDGARLWNAAVGSNTSPASVAEGFDTVSVCLSKGLGAPVGSVLAGNSNLVEEARRWRKMVGGGMRQAGVIAAGGLHAVQNNIERLDEDHQNAARLASGLSTIPGITITGCNTNMVFASVDTADMTAFNASLLANDVQTGGGPEIRMVCHLDISADDVDQTIGAFESAIAA